MYTPKFAELDFVTSRPRINISSYSYTCAMGYVDLRISSLFLTIRAGEKGSEGKKADGDLATSHYTKKND